MMINFCMKSVQSLFGSLNSNDVNETTAAETPRGLGFLTISGDIPRPTNVVESSSIKSPPSSPANTPKRHPGGIGFLGEVGGRTSGLMSCTESLGFESSDERRVDDDKDQLLNNNKDDVVSPRTRCKRITALKAADRLNNFPPPLPSLGHNGKPTFFLRPVRRNGRLEIIKIKVDQLEVLHVSREDGRLRLHLIRDVDVEDEAEARDQDQEEEVEKEEEKTEEIFDDDGEEEEEEEEEEEMGEELVFPVINGGGEGFRRCVEAASHHHYHQHHHHHHHHNLHAWSHRSVTIR